MCIALISHAVMDVLAQRRDIVHTYSWVGRFNLFASISHTQRIWGGLFALPLSSLVVVISVHNRERAGGGSDFRSNVAASAHVRETCVGQCATPWNIL